MKYKVYFTCVAHLNSHQSHFKCSVVLSGQELCWITVQLWAIQADQNGFLTLEKITSVGKGSVFLQRASFDLRDSDRALEVRFLHLAIGAMLLEEEIISRC